MISDLGTPILAADPKEPWFSTTEVVDEGPQPIPKIVYWDSRVEIYSSMHWNALIRTDLFKGWNHQKAICDI